MIELSRKKPNDMTDSNDGVRTHRIGGRLFGLFSKLRRLFHGYHPEKRYMRGRDEHL